MGFWLKSFPELAHDAHELRRQERWLNAAAVYLEAATAARHVEMYGQETVMLHLAWDCGWRAQGRKSKLED